MSQGILQENHTFYQSDIIRMLKAYHRIQVLTDHLQGGSFLEPVGGLSLALVPMPGTHENEMWMQMLQTRGGSYGLQVLKEWMEKFARSGPILQRALRRFRVLQAHLTTKTFIHEVV